MLKETRARGNEGYWYAYQRQGRRRIKQYAGRTPDLTISRLEELAHTPDFLTNKTHSIDRLSQQSRQEHIADDPSEYGSFSTLHEVIAGKPLLTSRLRPPPLQTALIRRERLLALLDASLECRLTWLSAPAGYGKTTLLAQWLAARRLPVAWLSLEREQNDPRLFLAYLIGALQCVHPTLGASILASVQVEGQVALSEGIVLLLNELAALPARIILWCLD